MRLQLESIRKSFGSKVAVDNLSLDVPEGVIYGIIGPNGAGKTTTIRMIMNITIPDSGQILIDGIAPGKDFKNRVGYLPEERGLYKNMTLIEVVRYMAELKGKSSRYTLNQIDKWLELMNLIDYKNNKVQELSKGMQQKLQFITTILHEPDLIILDELFSGLDPLNIEVIKNVILDLKRAGKTILFSTHVMEQAEKLCDYVCMISFGKKVIDGKLSEVKSKYGKNSVQIDMDGDGAFVSNLSGVKNVTEFNNYIELSLNEGANVSEILKSVVNRTTVRRFELVEPSLYDIFIDMARIDPLQYDKINKAGNNV
ncbi:MAG: ATP-binding cassette domain-containing protein [candidate division Zixibacteria bacterium]|nr:ATP-binding cassette domain-containing protein [candidate division Zixibacteria bacterium]